MTDFKSKGDMDAYIKELEELTESQAAIIEEYMEKMRFYDAAQKVNGWENRTSNSITLNDIEPEEFL